jgi:hypothetical protein
MELPMKSVPVVPPWTQLVLIPPSEIDVTLRCRVCGPGDHITYVLVVSDPETGEELAVTVTDGFGTSVLPASIEHLLRDHLSAARVAVSPF